MHPKDFRQRVGANNRFSGEIGQKLGEALLLRFLVPARPEPDPGFDAVAMLRPEYRINDLTAGVVFCFQFKTGRFTADARTVNHWLELAEQQPIFLVHVGIKGIHQQLYRFLSIHEWMLQRPSGPSRLTRQRTVTFPLSLFTLIDSAGSNFRVALQDEANRVCKTSGSLWRTQRSPHLPFSELDCFRRFGLLGELEVPASLVAGVKNDHVVDQDVWESLQQLARSAEGLEDLSKWPDARAWLQRISRAATRGEHAQDLKEFKRFRNAMHGAARGRMFDFPGFTYDETSRWRVLTQLFPESVRLLELLVERPRAFTPHQLMGASQLLATLSSTGDSTLSGRSGRALRALSVEVVSTSVNDLSQYSIVRQMLYTLAEASGDRSDVERCIDFVHAHPVEWDLALNRHYYRELSDDRFVRSTLGKIECPRERDLRTMRISEFFLDRFPNKLTDSARGTPSVGRAGV